MKIILLLSFGLAPLCSLTAPRDHYMAVGQGVSAPSLPSLVNYSNGFTHENPVGAVYHTGVKLSLMTDIGNDDDNESGGFGIEGGWGNVQYGVAIGFYDRTCDCNRDERSAIAFGGLYSNFGFGIRIEDDVYTLGAMFNPTQTHRLGLTIQTDGSSNNDITAFGLGYSYVINRFTVTLDASQRNIENNGQSNDLILLTPGVVLRLTDVSISLSFDTFINDDSSNTLDNDDFWWGVGYGPGANWHVALYSDYVNDVTLVGSWFF